MSELTITVSSSHELAIAINTLSDGSGGTILVENADEAYAISKYRAGTEAGEIFIKAADPEDPPTFAQVKLVQGQNITFSGLSFDSTESSLPGKDLEILQSSDITFENNTFVNASNGFFTGEDSDVVMGGALALIRDNKDFVFSGNDVSKYGQGLAIVDSVGSVITGNTISQMTGDGLRMSGVQDTLVEGNTFTDFYGSTQNVNHSDMIQVWSAPYNTLNTEDLVIRDNFLNSSDGVATQAIFIKNETFRDTGTTFKNITIEENTVYNGHVHGVAMYHTEGVKIANNTFLWDEQATMQSTPTSTPVSSAPTIRLVEIEGAEITGNIVANISAGPNNNVSDNVYVTYANPGDPNYVGNHFANVKDAGTTDIRDMTLLSDSPWNGEFGSARSQSSSEVDVLTPVIHQNENSADFGLVHYDASQSKDADGFLDPSDTTYTWSFSDGTVLVGETVTHRFESAGHQTVELMVETGEGDSAAVVRSSDIKNDTLVELNFDGGIVDSGTYESVVTEKGTRSEVDGITGDAFELNGSNDLSITNDNDQIYNLPSFTLSVALQRDVNGDAGTFVHMHRGMRAEITEDGSFKFTLRTSDGVFIAESAVGAVSEGEWHNLSVTFGEANGGLRLYVDGDLAASVEATGVTVTPENNATPYDLILGNTWGDSLQGRIDNFSLTRSVDGAAAGNEVTTSEIQGTTPEVQVLVQPIVSSITTQVDDPVTELDIEKPISEEFFFESPVEDLQDAERSAQELPLDLITARVELSGLENASLFNLDLEDGVSDVSGQGSMLSVIPAANEDTGDGFVLDGQSKIYVSRDNDHILEMDSFTLGLSLEREKGGDVGTFVHVHKALNIRITDDDELKVNMTTEDGSFEAITAPGVIPDTDWHRIAITYDGAEGGEGLKVYVDGTLQAETPATGSMASTGTYHMVFGNTWMDSLEGTIDDISLDASPLSALDIANDALVMSKEPDTSTDTTVVSSKSSLNLDELAMLDLVPDFYAAGENVDLAEPLAVYALDETPFSQSDPILDI